MSAVYGARSAGADDIVVPIPAFDDITALEALNPIADDLDLFHEFICVAADKSKTARSAYKMLREKPFYKSVFSFFISGLHDFRGCGKYKRLHFNVERDILG